MDKNNRTPAEQDNATKQASKGAVAGDSLQAKNPQMLDEIDGGKNDE